MKYLIDANILITAKNEYYGFDICPGFWEWVISRHREVGLFSIDKVQEELRRGNDELHKWVADKIPLGFFLETDDTTAENIAKINIMLNKEVTTGAQKIAKIAKFMGGADCYLVAYAMATGHEIITFEKGTNINSGSKIKIPSVCNFMNVKCHKSIFDLLKEDKPKFNYSTNQVAEISSINKIKEAPSPS